MVAVVEQPKMGHSKAAVIHDKRRTELVTRPRRTNVRVQRKPGSASII